MSTQPFTTYQQATDYLFQSTDYERMAKFRYSERELNLARMARLLEHAGAPQRGLRIIHIAGTKGKGSTAAMVTAILRRAGYDVGLYTSPHLACVRERIETNHGAITEDEVRDLMNELHPYLEATKQEGGQHSPTFFETFTGIALMHFRRRAVDFAVLEVGLGGRLDATNVVSPSVCAITSISYDHVDKLGSSLVEITREKAGIIKPGVPVVTAAEQPECLAVIQETVNQVSAPLYAFPQDFEALPRADGAFAIRTWRSTHDGLQVPLLGRHQTRNAAVAVAVIESLLERGLAEVSDEEVRGGLAAPDCHGRIELVSREPFIVLDVAHNVASAQALVETLRAELTYGKAVFVVGMSRDKDVEGILETLVPFADEIIFTKIDNPRSCDPAELLAKARPIQSHVRATTQPDPGQALADAKAQCGPNDLLCITGSFYLAGEMKRLLDEEGG